MSGSSLRLKATVVAAAALLAACSLAPSYERPGAPVASDFGVAGAGTEAGVAADIGWRQFFTDPQLQKLVELALANNRDLRVSVLNIEAARAQYRIQRAATFPTVNATGSASGERTAKDFTTSGEAETTHSYSAQVGITAYELDLFGRVRSLREQALEQYLGYEETRRSAQIALVAEVANAYLTWLADQSLLQTTQDTFKTRQESLDITRKRFDAGVSGELDVRQAETALESARASLAQYKRQVQQDRNALVLLVGLPSLPADLPAGRLLENQQLLADLPVGLPSEVLIQRPDVLAAEHSLKAANANIGAARAAFFPSITLTGSYGTMSSQFDGLFDSGSRTWTFAPQINIPIFTGGANTANLDLAKTQKNIYVAQYEKAIQTAFSEVADAMVARQTYDEQLQAQKALLVATQATYDLSEKRYRAGVDGYLDVLDAQRSLFSAQQSYVSAKLAREQSLVNLYRALGGGWNETAPTVAATP